jgi:hypothetical protein
MIFLANSKSSKSCEEENVLSYFDTGSFNIQSSNIFSHSICEVTVEPCKVWFTPKHGRKTTITSIDCFKALNKRNRITLQDFKVIQIFLQALVQF